MEIDFPNSGPDGNMIPRVGESPTVDQTPVPQDLQERHGRSDTPPNSPQEPPNQSMTEPSPVIESKLERSLRRLRELHGIGKQANLAASQWGVTTAMFAVEYKIDEDSLRKYKRFARFYSDAPGSGLNGLSQLDELCNIRRLDGLSLHFSYVAILMSIEDSSQRQRMAQLAADNNWLAPRLQAEIRYRARRPPGHGRPMQTPATVLDGLQQILRDGGLWLRRATTVVDSLLVGSSHHYELHDRRVRRALRDVARLLRRVHAESSRLVGELDLDPDFR